MRLLDYIVIILIIVYVLKLGSIHPSLLDELIALGILFYVSLKAAKKISPRPKRASQHSSSRQRNTYSEQPPPVNNKRPLTLNEAYKILGLLPGASLEEVKRAYKEKISKNHPDKVSHLSEELQEKAKELTILINQSYLLIINSLKK